jgi:1-acyl-sn-glycerol-3-phosphate acyltransferase
MLTQEIRNNIKTSIEKGELNNKVMISDHVVTASDRKRHIFTYDNTKRKFRNKIKCEVATLIVNRLTKKINQTTQIVGLDNLVSFKGAGIITANHFSPVDSTVVRFLANKIGKKRNLSIVVAEANVFMPGKLGWLLKNVNSIPFANDLTYIERNFNPSLEKRLKQGHLILIYPEQEMWPGYIKPRKLKPGAYHYACKYHVPIIPTFITMKKMNETICYTIHVFPLIYSDSSKTLKENKERMMELDYQFKKKCYESFYNKELTYDFSDSDFID